MIYTITLNPSLDYIMHVEDFKEGETNRSYQEEIYLGGKGFNVSTILSRLGLETTALGFVAGFTGKEIECRLKERGFESHLCYLEKGMSRINIKMKGIHETEINGQGPDISQEKIDELFEQLNKITSHDVLVLAGSIPSSVSSHIYEDIMHKLSHKNIKIIVDATKDLLRNVLPYHPFLVKPNQRELEEFFNIEIKSQNDVIIYAKKIKELGAQNVLVSLGKEGALLVDENNHVYYCQAAKGKLKNSVGSGDSMVAGFIAGYLLENDYKEALKLGSACGGATAFSDDLASKDQIDEVYRQLLVEEI